MDQALPQITINTNSGRPYISVIDEGKVFGIQLHEYTENRIVVHLDKKCIPQLVDALQIVDRKN